MSEPPTATFRLVPFPALTLLELNEIFHLRDVVFVVGQKITSEPEVDGRDDRCSHVLVREDDRLVGTARVFLDRTPRVVGRIAVHPERQRGGLGTWLMERLQAAIAGAPAELHAQRYLEGWYAGLGWVRCSDEFMEAEIPHIKMRWEGAPR